MIEEQNIPVEDGEPAPLWKDRIRESNPLGRGRQKNSDWSNSVLRYIKPYVAKIGWKTTIVCRETLAAMRLMADKHTEVAQVIERWDGYSAKEKTRIFSIDKACFETGADRDEFAGLVLAAVGKHVKRNALAIVDANFEKLIAAACDHAITGGARGMKERVELIKWLTRPDRTANPVAPKTESPVQGEPSAEGRQAQSLDQSMAELDGIESIGVE